jgi:predicted RNase H-like HicB family nuclease
MLNYSIALNWSEEDNGFIATVPEFPYLSAFGETRDSALAEAEIALKGFIEDFEEDGEELPPIKEVPSYSGQLRLRMGKSLHARLSIAAQDEGLFYEDKTENAR